MKNLRHILAITVCLALLFSVVLPASAASAVLLRRTQDGYNCVGQGHIVDNVARGGFQATSAGGLLQTIDPENCSSKVKMIVYDADGMPLTMVSGNEGTLQAGAVYESSTEIAKVDFYYQFNSATWGPFALESDG